MRSSPIATIYDTERISHKSLAMRRVEMGNEWTWAPMLNFWKPKHKKELSVDHQVA